FRVLDYDNITGGTKDGKISGYRASGSKGKHRLDRHPLLNDQWLEKSDEGYIRDKLADHHAYHHDDRDRGDCLDIDHRLEEPCVKDALHQYKEGCKEDQGVPINFPYQFAPSLAQEQQGC